MSHKTGITAYLKKNLKNCTFGHEIHYFQSVPSTMDIAKGLADKGAPEGTVVIAGTQKAGRGRLGRTWLSPEGSLAMSVILRPSREEMRYLPAISSLAVQRTITTMGIPARIKWPNDVLIKGKKVCGILIENELAGADLRYSIVGIGINVNFNTEKFPEIAEIATSISVHLKKEVPVAEVALQLLTELESLYVKISDTHGITREWVDSMETIGRRIRVNMGDSIEEGIAEIVNQKGNLVLRRDDGTVLEIVAGDVTLLKD